MKILIIVDMQNGFINENNKFLIENIENLLKKQEFDEVFATKFINHSASQYVEHLDWNKMKRSGLTEFAISLPANVKVIEKETYGLKDRMFAGNSFRVGKKVFTPAQDQIYICGTDYDACVLAIGYQFFDHGFQPHFILDCVGSHSYNPVSKVNFVKLCTKDFGKDAIIKNYTK